MWKGAAVVAAGLAPAALVLAALVLAGLALTGVATAQELPIDVKVIEMVNLPRERPSLTVLARGEVRSARVAVSEAGRRVVVSSFGRLGAGASRVISWKTEPGVHEYVIEVSGRTAEGTASAVIESTVTVMRPLELGLRRDQIDVEERRLHFTMNNPAGRAELQIFAASGKTLHESETDFSRRPAGTRLDVTWPALPEPIQRMVLRGYDASESWSEFELLPFRIDIPHDDVVFETAKWEIREAETPKLDDAYDAILDAIREHGQDLKARLYVLGHTDTVGSPADNQLLSERRARAIAEYFRDRGGISLPILSRGFGEAQLAVQTADSVDEVRNRRAQYILAAQAPAAGSWSTVSAGK